MPNPKSVENLAFAHLLAYVEKHLPGAALESTMNKGRGSHPALADAELVYSGRIYHVEIKASSKAVGHNLRFTHQTITNAIGKDLIVALISNIETPNPQFEFFRLSDVADDLTIEPHFLITSKRARTRVQPLSEILPLADGQLDVSALLASEVRSHTRLKHALAEGGAAYSSERLSDAPSASTSLPTAARFWSPFLDDADEDGYPYPPWLKYPNIPFGSIGWRMGDGEEYGMSFHDWFSRQPVDIQARFKSKYVPPADWSGFFGGE